MNILMLGWELPPYNSGGLGVACLNISRALAREGARIDFVLPYQADHSEITFMNVHAAIDIPPQFGGLLGAYTAGQSIIPGVSLGDKATDIRNLQRRYTRFVESFVQTHEIPDAIHAHDWLTAEAALRARELTGAPLIIHVHATEFDRAGGTAGNPLIHEIEQEAFLMADRIIAVSQFTKRLIVQNYQIPPDKIEVVYNALNVDDIEQFNYDQQTYRYLESLQREGYTIVSTVTRFTVQKGLVQLLHAAAQALSMYDKLVFLFAGDGEQRDELIRLSAELGIADKIYFTGFVRGKHWRDAFSIADIFVMSSISEPFGITALEAAHFGDALIITKQSGVSEIITNSFTYDFWDTRKLADQLIAIATSEGLKETLRQNAAGEYARLSWEDVAKQCIGIYRNLHAGVRV